MGRLSGVQIREGGSEMDGNPGSLENDSRTNTQESCCSVSECQLFSLSKTFHSSGSR